MDFDYLIQFHEDENLLSIEATDSNKYTQWSTMIDDRLIESQLEESLFDYELAPADLFQIFAEYASKQLPTDISLKFQKHSKQPNSSVLIEIESNFALTQKKILKTLD